MTRIEVEPDWDKVKAGARALLDYELSVGWDGATAPQRSSALDTARVVLAASEQRG